MPNLEEKTEKPKSEPEEKKTEKPESEPEEKLTIEISPGAIYFALVALGLLFYIYMVIAWRPTAKPQVVRSTATIAAQVTEPTPEPIYPTTAPSRIGKYTGPYDPFGPDRDCGDFARRRDAQAFYRAAGGPSRDPHRLDRDNDGEACENLP